MSKPESISVEDVKYIREDSIVKNMTYMYLDGTDSFFKKGEKYFIRTVTNYYTGLCVGMNKDFVKLIKVSWIADTGRFMDAMKSGNFKEIEPYMDTSEVCISIGSIIDFTPWNFDLPNSQK